MGEQCASFEWEREGDTVCLRETAARFESRCRSYAIGYCVANAILLCFLIVFAFFEVDMAFFDPYMNKPSPLPWSTRIWIVSFILLCILALTANFFPDQRRLRVSAKEEYLRIDLSRATLTPVQLRYPIGSSWQESVEIKDIMCFVWIQRTVYYEENATFFLAIEKDETVRVLLDGYLPNRLNVMPRLWLEGLKNFTKSTTLIGDSEVGNRIWEEFKRWDAGGLIARCQAL